MEFTFIAPMKTIFRSGALDEIGKYIGGYGKRFLIVIDPVFEKNGTLARVQKELDAMGIAYTAYLGVVGEPDVSYVDDASAQAREFGCDAVLSIGGGSSIDVGKAAAGVITNGGHVKEYLEYVGTGRKVEIPPLPFIAMPTTAGTGAEVTKNAVIGSKKEHFKRSMRDDQLIANLCILDPKLCVSAPPRVTAIAGIDAITHLMEAYATWKAHPMSKALALQGLELAGRYLQRAYDNGEDLEAREGMSLAAYLGGISFSNSGLGAAHGLGMAINIYFPVPHGFGVGVTLPYVMEINAKDNPTLYDAVGEAFAGKRFDKPGEGTQVAIQFIKDLNAHIGIPADLKELNVSEELAETMGNECFGSSMSGNPVQLSGEEWGALFKRLI
ncbi:MAG: iron-containing alcohol dehydrogenase [Clostridiales bacterium]|jgi:alcohol dehydrogenase class IV|nr:iron-containing alcohol dehydrogenase [Clostridiales bacterium]